MSSSLPSAENLKPCYFFYGEETYLSQQFIQDVSDLLFPDDEDDFPIERFSQDEKSWAEVIDMARTVPFFTSRKLMVFEIANSKAKLSAVEEKILIEYFQTDSVQTVLIVVYPGKVKKSAPLVKFFSSLPSAAVSLEEMKPLKEWVLVDWVEKKFHSFRKRVARDALLRLIEMTGNNLTRIQGEIEKIALYVGERESVDLDDVNLVSGYVKSFIEWEMAENLEKGDYQQSLLVLDKLLKKEGAKPELVFGYFSRFFSNILTAKLHLSEMKKDKKAIFREFKPQIQEKFGNFYTSKFNEFFALVGQFSETDLFRFLAKLDEIDLKIKTSGAPMQIQLEGFLFEYCRWRAEDKLILGRKR